jgi:hypothetical protein
MDPIEKLANEVGAQVLTFVSDLLAGRKTIVIEKHTIHRDEVSAPVIEHRVVVR